MPHLINVDLTSKQITHLIVAARSAAEIYRDSYDAAPELKLQEAARSLEQAIVRLDKVNSSLDPNLCDCGKGDMCPLWDSWEK